MFTSDRVAVFRDGQPTPEAGYRSAGSLDATSPGLDLKMDAQAKAKAKAKDGRGAFRTLAERAVACLRAVAWGDLRLNQRILK
jgi:hypothetical protein